jgi:hypothetical protein
VLGLPLVSKRLRLTAVLVVAMVSLAACGESAEQAATPSTAAASRPAPPAPTLPAKTPASGATAAIPSVLDFTAPKLGGGQVVGSELVGRDVAAFFWAPW